MNSTMETGIGMETEIEHELARDLELEPIAGVGLALYARVVRSIATVNHDVSMLGPMAALHGVDTATWDEARSGWNQRISRDQRVAAVFCELYEID